MLPILNRKKNNEIINIEWGDFDKNLPQNDIDKEVDENSLNPKQQLCEKNDEWPIFG